MQFMIILVFHVSLLLQMCNMKVRRTNPTPFATLHSHKYYTAMQFIMQENAYQFI